MTYAHKQREIARESGMSFERVVKGYAEEGYSMSRTAYLLDYNRSSFIRLCDRHGWREWFVSGQECKGAVEARQSRRGKDTPALAKARGKRSYETVQHDGINDTYAGHARRLGLSVRTVYNRARRRPGDFEYIFSCNNHVTSPCNKNHHWRNI